MSRESTSSTGASQAASNLRAGIPSELGSVYPLTRRDFVVAPKSGLCWRAGRPGRRFQRCLLGRHFSFRDYFFGRLSDQIMVRRGGIPGFASLPPRAALCLVTPLRETTSWINAIGSCLKRYCAWRGVRHTRYLTSYGWLGSRRNHQSPRTGALEAASQERREKLERPTSNQTNFRCSVERKLKEVQEEVRPGFFL